MKTPETLQLDFGFDIKPMDKLKTKLPIPFLKIKTLIFIRFLLIKFIIVSILLHQDIYPMKKASMKFQKY